MNDGIGGKRNGERQKAKAKARAKATTGIRLSSIAISRRYQTQIGI